MSQAFRTLQLLRKDGQAPSPAVCSALLQWCCAQRPSSTLDRFARVHPRIMSVEQAMVEGSLQPSAQLLLTLLSAYAHAGDAVKALSVLQAFKVRDFPLNGLVYNQVLRSLSQASVPTPAAQELLRDPAPVLAGLVRDMHDHGVELDVHLLNAFLRIFLRSLSLKYLSLNSRAPPRPSGPDAPQVSVEEGTSATSGTSGPSGPAGPSGPFVSSDSSGTGGLWSPAQQYHISTAAYDFFLESVQGSRWHPAVQPDLRSFNILVKLFCRSNEVHRALSLLDVMEQDYSVLGPDLESYNTILRVLVRRDPVKAEDLFIRMTNNQLLPNEETMDVFLLGYMLQSENATEQGSGLSMIQSCFNQYHVRPRVDSFRKVIAMFQERGSHDEAQRAGYIFMQLWPDEQVPEGIVLAAAVL